jgi:hypothetical protein
MTQPTTARVVDVDGKTFVVRGRLMKTMSLQDEWQADVDDPSRVIHAVRASRRRVDLLKFWQRPPDTAPKFSYYHEWVEVAGIPITTYEHWWNQQINTKTRNMVRKPSKLGVVIDEVGLTDAFVAGVTEIFNQSPVRRGKRFWHYGKNQADTRRMLSDQLERSIFIGAFLHDELIGYIKLIRADRLAMITMILDKTAHRDKSPMNAMIAKAVEVCAQRGIPLLTYTVWRRGSHGEFQKRNGFEKIPVPLYYVPLTGQGRIALRLGLHKGVKGALPDSVYEQLLGARKWWYERAARLVKGERKARASVAS